MENKEEQKEKDQQDKPVEGMEVLVNKAKLHIASVKEQVLKYTGKINHNPYVWLKTKGFTLAEAMIANPEAYKAIDVKICLTNILNIKAEAPIVISPPILDRGELNDKIEKEKEAKKSK